ncbi:glycosyltransferase [Vibrio breoganii]
MIILHLTLGLGNGGAEGALFRLITNDGSNKHIVISVMGDGIYGERLRSHGVEVISFDVKRGKIPFNVPFRILYYILKIKPDVFQSWLYHSDILGGVLAKISGVKRIYWGIRHSNLEPNVNSKTTLIMAKVSALLSTFIPKGIISCSYKATQVHVDLGYKESKFHTISNGYDFSELYFSKSGFDFYRNKYDVSEQFVFGMVGRWNPQKNHENLFKALRHYLNKYGSNIKLFLVGPEINEKNSELVTLIDSYNLWSYIELIGPVSPVNNVMSSFDALVLPSLGEAFPNVLAESMACGVPVVSTDVGDASYIVGNTGWIVPSNSPVDLCEAMSECASLKTNNIDSWNQLKVKAKTRVKQNFSIEHMVSQFNQAWKA